MLLLFQGLVLVQPTAHLMTPDAGQRHEREQLLQPFLVRDVRVFQLKAARFQGRKERFKTPAARIVRQRRRLKSGREQA